MKQIKNIELPLRICLASLKGGGGKSNLVSNLGVAFQRKGYKVALVDSDRVLNTTQQWSDDRAEYIENNPKTDAKPIFTIKKNGRLFNTIAELSDTYDIIIIDTGGQDSTELRAALGVVDLAITPVETTQEALDGVAPFVAMINEIQDIRAGSGAAELETLAVLSRAVPNSPKRIAASRDYLADPEFVDSGLVVASTFITDRVAYPDTKERGLAVADSKTADHAVAKEEIESLSTEILDLMSK